MLADQLAPILEAIAIVSPVSFMFAGLTGHALNADLRQMPAASRPQKPVVALLQQYLYQYCYCKEFPDSLQSEIQALADMTDLTPELSAANVSRDRWDYGWQIDQLLPSGQ